MYSFLIFRPLCWPQLTYLNIDSGGGGDVMTWFHLFFRLRFPLPSTLRALNWPCYACDKYAGSSSTL